jgi:hypothetical protein
VDALPDEDTGVALIATAQLGVGQVPVLDQTVVVRIVDRSAGAEGGDAYNPSLLYSFNIDA